MGIHGLLEYLRKEAPEYSQTADVKSLGIRRVALDGHQWMTMTTKKVIADAYASAPDPWVDLTQETQDACLATWLRMAVCATCSWLSLGIEPVWVFDGPSPVAKAERKAERKADRDRAMERLEALCCETSSLSSLGTAVGSWIHPTSDKDLRSKILSLRMQIVTLQPGWQDALLRVLTVTGTPWVVGATEGEKVACMLWKEGVVDAVVSTDTDCLVYGCDRVITSPRAMCVDGRVIMTFYARAYILEFLELTDEQFVEFCIACGCDYNTNIPKIGPVKVHELMRTYGTLSAWPETYKKTRLDQTCLNVDTCKLLFAPCASNECISRRASTLSMDWNAWMRCDDDLLNLLGNTPSTHSLLTTMQHCSD